MTFIIEYDHNPYENDNSMGGSKRRVERFRELGRLEKDRVAYNSKHLDQRLSKEAYLDKHLKKYPSLEKTGKR